MSSPTDREISNLGQDELDKYPTTRWDHKYQVDDLEYRRQVISETIKDLREELDSSKLIDPLFWDAYARYADLRREDMGYKSRDKAPEWERFNRNTPPEDYYQDPMSLAIKQRYQAYGQRMRTIERQRAAMGDAVVSKNSVPRTLTRLFKWNKRWTRNWSEPMQLTTRERCFIKALKKAYCPVVERKSCKWDPILARQPPYPWRVEIVPLYPWMAVDVADSIFGEGTAEDIFEPPNGLFLQHKVRRAFCRGQIAIVPDIDLCDDEDLFDQRVREWEKLDIKEYRTVVLQPDADEVLCPWLGTTVNERVSITDRNGKKLTFLTDYRPREKYLWWMFLSAILHMHWDTLDGEPHLDMAKLMRLWAPRGKYMKKKHLLAFVEEIGEDVRDILHTKTCDDAGDDVKPDYEAIAAMANGAMDSAAYDRDRECALDCGFDYRDRKAMETESEEEYGFE